MLVVLVVVAVNQTVLCKVLETLSLEAFPNDLLNAQGWVFEMATSTPKSLMARLNENEASVELAYLEVVFLFELNLPVFQESAQTRALFAETRALFAQTRVVL